jgi:hypothetical protein
LFRSQKLYLPTDTYRLKIMAEQDLVWQSFLLRPRSAQQRRAATVEARRVTVEAGPPPELPLALRLSATNRATGEPLAVPFSVDINRNGGWMELTPEIRGELTTGAVHRFRFRAEGFFDEEYALLVEPYQSDLVVSADLTPYPAAVQITGAESGTSLRVDGGERYLRGGRRVALEAVPQPDGEPVELRLLPGERRILLERGDASASATLRLSPLDRRVLGVSFNEESGTLEVERLEATTDPSLARDGG